MKNLKDKLTNVLAIIIIIAGVLNTYMQSIGDEPINWYQLVIALVGAVVSWFTGKTADGKTKQL